MQNTTINSAYIIGMVSEIDKEYLITGDVKRPLMKIHCYNSNNQLVEIPIVFSSISQIRKSSIYEVGDIIQIYAYIGESIVDQIVFYPQHIHLLKKNPTKIDNISEHFIKSRLLPYIKEKNQIFFEGRIKNSYETKTCIEIENIEIVRGNTICDFHIWVNHLPSIYNEGEYVLFLGEMEKENKLVGQLFKKERI